MFDLGSQSTWNLIFNQDKKFNKNQHRNSCVEFLPSFVEVNLQQDNLNLKFNFEIKNQQVNQWYFHVSYMQF